MLDVIQEWNNFQQHGVEGKIICKIALQLATEFTIQGTYQLHLPGEPECQITQSALPMVRSFQGIA